MVVVRGADDEPGRIEIELEVDDHRPARRRDTVPRADAADPVGPSAPRPWTTDHPGRAVAAVSCVVALVAVVSFGLGRASGSDEATAPVPSTTVEVAVETTATRPTLPPVTTRPATTTTQPLIAITESGGPVLGVPVGARLVGLTAEGDLASLDLDTGRLVVTDLEPFEVPRGEGSITPVGQATIVQSWMGASPVLVPALGAPERLQFAIGDGSPLHPGPLPDTLWRMYYRDQPPTGELILVDLEGREVAPRVPLGSSSWPAASLADGSVLVNGSGGTYVVDVDGVRRLSTGRLAGWGARHVLVEECDEALRCGYVVVAAETGERFALSDAGLGDGSFVWDSPTVSPDGSAIAVYGARGSVFGLSLLDVGTGEVTALPQARSDVSAVAWTPDSRFVLFGSSGVWSAFDRVTGAEVELPVGAVQFWRFVVVPTA
jgi:hypothetical protein